MKRLAKLLYPQALPPNNDLALLVLRIATMLPLFLKHGLEKIQNFSAMSQNFPDPVGLGVLPTFLIAFLSDAICSWLVMVGIGTRWLALFIFCNLFVGWSMRHHFVFWIRSNWHGEMMVVYMGAILVIVLAGPGKYCLDTLIQKKLNAA